MSQRRIVIAALVLAVSPAAADPPRTDLVGDPLPPGAVARLGTTRLRGYGWGGGLHLLPDGRRALWVGDGGRVTVWDVATGRALDSFRDPDLAGERITLSPDADRLALFDQIRSDRGKYELTLRVYDLKARKTAWSVRPAGTEPRLGYWVDFTPDGKRLITLSEADLRVWDAASGAELLRQKLPGYGYLHFVVSPDGKILAAGERKVLLWDWESGAAPRKVPLGTNFSVSQVQFAPDGKTVYASTRGNA
jgi:WD40 repeat protein